MSPGRFGRRSACLPFAPLRSDRSPERGRAHACRREMQEATLPAFDIGRCINPVCPWSGCRYEAIGSSSTTSVPPDLAIPVPVTSPKPRSTPSRRRSHRRPPGDAVPGKAPLRAGARTLTGVEGHPAVTYRLRPSVHPHRRHAVRFGPGIVWSPANGMVEDRAPHRWIPVNPPRTGGATWACVATGLGMGATNTVRRCRTPWSATGSPPAAWWPNSRVSAGRSGRSFHELHRSGGEQGGTAAQ